MVWRGLRIGPSAFNVLLLGGAVWLAVTFHFATSFFDAPLPLEQKLNRTMLAKRAGGELRSVDLTYRPSRRARSLLVIFNFTGPRSAFSALRLGGGPGFEAAWLSFEDGQVRHTTPLPDAAAGGDFTLSVEGDTLAIRRDGRLLAAPEFHLRNDVVAFAAYPAYVLQPLRPQLEAIEKLTVVTADGQRHRLWPLWWREALALLAALALAAGYLIVDRSLLMYARRVATRSRGLATLFGSYPVWPLLLLLAGVSLSIAQDQAKRNDPAATWYGSFVRDGSFDVDAFVKNPELTKDGETLRLDLSADVDHIVAYGGSTTHGVPYGREVHSWPAQLGRILRANAASPDRRWDVDNLGFAGNYLETNFPPVADAFLRAVKPKAVVIHSLLNEYLKERPWDNVFQAMGFADRQSPDEPGARERYLADLAAVIDRMRALTPLVVVVEPPIDYVFFDGNPLREWQDAMCAVAAEHGAVVVRLQETFDGLDNRFVFYEYMHQTVAGNERVAAEIFAVLRPYLNFEKVE